MRKVTNINTLFTPKVWKGFQGRVWAEAPVSISRRGHGGLKGTFWEERTTKQILWQNRVWREIQRKVERVRMRDVLR